jgi:hypothetical protein
MEMLGVQTARTIDGVDMNGITDMYQLPAYEIDETTPLSTVTGYVDDAINTGSTVILLFHNIADVPAGQYDYSTTDFQSIIDYIANAKTANQINVLTVSELYQQEQSLLAPLNIVVNTATGNKDSTVDLIATLTSNGVAVQQKSVQFYVDGSNVGSAITDANGNATLSYLITQNSGTYNIVANFIHSTIYKDTNSTNNLQVNLIPTNIAVSNISGLKDTLTYLVATVTDNNGKAVPGTVQFLIDGISVGSPVTTDANGNATLSHTITETLGPHTILAQFTASDIGKYASYQNSSTLTVGLTPTNILVATVNGPTNTLVNLIATLTDNNNKAIAGKSIQFSIDGTPVAGSPVTTDANGNATLPYTVTQNQGKYTISANFAADDKYDASTNTSSLTVPDTTAPTAWDNAKGGLYKNNQIVTLAMSEPGTIYYTLNGGTPNIQYINPITISQTCTMNYNAVDLAGNPSPKYSESYNIDKIRPVVKSTTPANKKTKVSKTSSIIIKFSETISKSTNWSKIYVKNEKKNKKISISKKLSKNTLTIKTSKRSSKTTYKVYLPGGSVKDTAGNNLAVHYSTTFKTA